VDTKKLRLAWMGLIGTQHWDVFVTLTFDRRLYSPHHDISPEKADKAFRRLIRYFNEWLYGARWMRKSPHKGVIWARSQEAHKDGVLHFHACLQSPSRPMTQGLLQAALRWWKHRFGFARFELPRSQRDVISYLTKHVGPGGCEAAEIELSHNFPKIE
jgi:hypothetical protein